jgi:2-polyprenyl-6-methoxyphenol hydroxylase-like FAD-dependent oxidoreductase
MEEVLIVGQGLAGTLLSWWLHKAGIPFKVIDQQDPNSASARAAGLINPVTGRRLVTTWMIDELMSFASGAYKGNHLKFFIKEVSVIISFPAYKCYGHSKTI